MKARLVNALFLIIFGLSLASCGETNTPTSTPSPTPTPTLVPPTPTPSPAHLKVSFTEVYIDNNPEPLGMAGEVWLDLTVNGQTKRWPPAGEEKVKSKQKYALPNLSFNLILSDIQEVTITVNGTEKDVLQNDQMGTVIISYKSSNNWGIGPHSEKSNCPKGCYTISYVIERTS